METAELRVNHVNLSNYIYSAYFNVTMANFLEKFCKIKHIFCLFFIFIIFYFIEIRCSLRKYYEINSDIKLL